MYNNISFTRFDKERSVLHVNDRLHFLLDNGKRQFLEQEISSGSLAIDDLCHELEMREGSRNEKVFGLQNFQLKVELISENVMDKLVFPFCFLFNKIIMAFIVVLSLGVCFYGMCQDYAMCISDKLPLSMVLLVFIIMCIFHEIGHSCACKYYKAPVNGVGFGIAAYRPVMYADVTGAWYLMLSVELDEWARLLPTL